MRSATSRPKRRSGGRSPSSRAEKLPESEADLFRLLSGHAHDAVAVIEAVHATPFNGSIACFQLGRSYGFLRGCLVALGIPFVEVSPMKWQRALDCLTPAGPPVKTLTTQQQAARKRDHKNAIKARAQQLYPHLDVTLATADALMLALYCARQDWRGIGR